MKKMGSRGDNPLRVQGRALHINRKEIPLVGFAFRLPMEAVFHPAGSVSPCLFLLPRRSEKENGIKVNTPKG